MTKGKTRYYLSPVSGRIIKSTGRTYNTIKEEGYFIDKHPCLYNINSAKKCLERLLRRYPSIAFPPSSFLNIPRTGDTKIRGVVYDETNTRIRGIVDKRGKLKGLKKEIDVSKDESLQLPSIQDPYGMLQKALNTKEPATDEEHEEIKRNLHGKRQSKKAKRKLSLVYNPVHDDIVPMKDTSERNDMVPMKDASVQKEVLNVINSSLVPSTLPPVKEELDVAGIIENENDILGYMNTDNEIKRYDPPLRVKGDLSKLPRVKLTEDVKKEVAMAPLASTKKRESISLCLDGEQYETSKRRCMPCGFYGLEWDPIYKKCRVKIKAESLIPSYLPPTENVLLMDNNNQVIGYLG